MHTNSSILRLPAMTPPARARTGIFKRNARKVEREMIVHSELAFRAREKFPLVMSLLSVVRWMSGMITGL